MASNNKFVAREGENTLGKVNFGDLPASNQGFGAEDVEFSEEIADEADHMAQERAAQADRRQTGE
ncbi:YfhD family protein [Paenibacillus sp. strain BS8-2]